MINAVRGPPAIKGSPLDQEYGSSELTRDGLFEVDALHTWQWAHRMSTQKMHDLLNAFNGWNDGQIATATKAVQGCGVGVTENYTTMAYVLSAGFS